MSLRVALSPFCWTMLFVFLSVGREVHQAALSRDLIPTELLLVPHELCAGQADPSFPWATGGCSAQACLLPGTISF